MGVVVDAGQPHARPSRTAIRIDTDVVCADVDIRRIGLDISHLCCNRLVHVLDVAISGIITLSK